MVHKVMFTINNTYVTEENNSTINNTYVTEENNSTIP
jgi:hypothetical protein